MHPWIDTNQGFRDFCNALPAGTPIALDTEFAWTKTYFPQFALLQIGIDRTHAALVDPLAVTDWTPLAEILADETRRKILFSGSNDLPILVRACQGVIPKNVFDVQTAAGFCGEPSSQSLKSVIEAHLGISLPKTETRSDWTIRPLTDNQRQYAADDVVLLPELAIEFEAKLSANGNLAWFLEEMNTAHCRPEAYELPSTADAWRRLGGLRHLQSAQARQRAIALAIWREETARANDIARPRVLSDNQIYWCASNAPTNSTELFKMPECWPKRIRPFADDLLELIANPPALPPVAKTPLIPRQALNDLSDRILNFLRKRAAERQIDSAIVGARHDAEKYTLNLLQHKTPTGKLCTGWRSELLAGLADIKAKG